MQGAAVRPYINAGVALVGASVIAVAPLAPAPPHIALPTIHSAEVALSAAASPLQAYAELLNNTFTNVGTLTHQTFQNGVAPLLTQVLINQLTMVQGLGHAAEEALQISNPSSIPALLQKALGEIAAGQFQTAGETLATGVIQVAFPFLPSLLQPLNNLVAVVNQLPNIALVGSLAVIQPPLALVQATGQAVQAVADAVGAGDPLGVVNALVSAPAVMINGFLNGYAPTQTGGLLTPGLGTLSLLVNIRDMIVSAITPTAAATTTATTDAVTSTKTAAAKVVTLDVAPQQETTGKATESSSETSGSTAAEGQAASGKDTASAETATKGETSGKTSTPAADETSSSSETPTTGTAATGETTTKGDTATKGDTTSKDDTSAATDSGKDTGAASTAKGDSTTKASETKKDSGASEKAGTEKAAKK